MLAGDPKAMEKEEMIDIIDTYSKIPALFANGTFQLEKWKTYINSIYDDSAHIFTDEVDAYLASGKYTFEKDFLPIIDAVCGDRKLDTLHTSFLTAVEDLNQRILQNFDREVDTDIVLYLGLCNAAGRVTVINGRQTILLGVEKIIELNWHELDSMYGLVYHELGHVYHSQHGNLEQTSGDNRRDFVWQLFTEGFAMYFEQALVGDFDFFHQGSEWKKWCDDHFEQILTDFDRDLPAITRFDQRYFGDWASYFGHGDVGYYLGNRFVHRLRESYSVDALINLDIESVYELYCSFVQKNT